MVKNLIRFACMAPKIQLADPIGSADRIAGDLASAAASSPDIILLPSLCLGGASCGALFRNRSFIEDSHNAIKRIAQKTASISAYIIVGGMGVWEGKLTGVNTVLYKGEIVGRSPSRHLPDELREDALAEGFQSIFVGGVKILVAGCDPRKLPGCFYKNWDHEVAIVVNPSAIPVDAGTVEECRQSLSLFSKHSGCAVINCNGNVGESTSPYLYKGFCGIYEDGEELTFASDSGDMVSVIADVDYDVISSTHGCALDVIDNTRFNVKPGLMRSVRRNPFIPADGSKLDAFLYNLFDLQVRSLTGRMQNANIDRMVIGVSGGVDSTLSLLVSAAAARRMNLLPDHIVAITMPGMGTSGTTRDNAVSLMDALGISHREISIQKAVEQHFKDIGHDPAVKDVTYENAQARERCQILLDVANSVGGLVIGTGDLSESTLGWCTYGGDHLASYNVNTCITKTIAKMIVSALADHPDFTEAKEVLGSIVETPVSPELLPTTHTGDIAQKTEDILGPYELHEFFLYYFVKYNFAPSKIYYYACVAFAQSYAPDFIKETLKTFIDRFFKGQFKRSCSPDSAVILGPSLWEFQFPSDASSETLLAELDSVNGNPIGE